MVYADSRKQEQQVITIDGKRYIVIKELDNDQDEQEEQDDVE